MLTALWGTGSPPKDTTTSDSYTIINSRQQEEATTKQMSDNDEIMTAESNNTSLLDSNHNNNDDRMILPTCSTGGSSDDDDDDDNNGPVSLEGMLLVRKGRSISQNYYLRTWKKRFVVFNFLDGGSIAVYKTAPPLLPPSSPLPPPPPPRVAQPPPPPQHHPNNDASSSNSIAADATGAAATIAAAAPPPVRSLMTSPSQPSSALRTVYSRVQRSLSLRDVTATSATAVDNNIPPPSSSYSSNYTSREKEDDNLVIELSSELPWIIKDVENDPATFVLELPTNNNEDFRDPHPHGRVGGGGGGQGLEVILEHYHQHDEPHHHLPSQEYDDRRSSMGTGTTMTNSALRERILSDDQDIAFDSDDYEYCEEDDDDIDADADTLSTWQGGGNSSCIPDHHHMDDRLLNASSAYSDDLLDEIHIAQSRGKPLRIYFRCDVETNEKALWLKAFSSFGRLSNDLRKKKSLFSSLVPTTAIMQHLGHSRIRSQANERIARDARQLDWTSERLFDNQELLSDTTHLTHDVESIARGVGGNTSAVSAASATNGGRDKEFRVLPSYAYPHRWLTKSEMREEMVLPSETFHDLRVPGCKEKEIGSLKVEVLQCLGLPKLDRGSDTDAVVYLVCGSYAFSTDVIFNRTNPMWLRKSRRACNFPLYHGYARLYVGVFDDETRRVKDDFAGRVVVNLAQLRPCSTYDVTLPLRLSTHVYSRRRRGAIRLRLTVNWKSERDALLSYLPKTLRIPLPQHTTPDYRTTVMCSDQKAFRNIAITVHGAHLPGRFTFNQMRAAIREINFTRKCVFTALRQTIRETRLWHNPAISAFVFFSWMHCIYANTFALVPAYVMSYVLLQLMRNYARYCADGPSQRGFVPPTWEELFMALVRSGRDTGHHSIEPLELGLARTSLNRQRSPSSMAHSQSRDEYNSSQFNVTTHKPRGKKLLQALGFLTNEPKDSNEDHLEFPFAEGKDYPKFSVRECLVTHGPAGTTSDAGGDSDDGNSTVHSRKNENGDHHHQQSPQHRHSVRHRMPLDMDRMMRKDLSGTKDFDDEENNFRTTRAVMFQGRKAASKMTKTATALSSKTGLDYVVRPIHSGISSGVGHVSSGVGHMSSVAGSMTSHVIKKGMARRGSTDSLNLHEHANDDSGSNGNDVLVRHEKMDEASDDRKVHPERRHAPGQRTRYFEHLESQASASMYGYEDPDKHTTENELNDAATADNNGGTMPANRSDSEEIDPALVMPEQDIDVEEKATGKKLVDDLAEIKDKMHELTWHLFDDHTYVIKNPNSVFFRETKKPENRRKTDPSKQIDKYLHMGQYSHSNPFVARVGMYVEPIIGSSYSILCFFRAGFNVATWRDPMLTFWLSFFVGIISVVLFFFPWRIFLFVVGVLAVGPQNWAIRILREQGHLPPAPSFKNRNSKKSLDEEKNWDEIPVDKPVFSKESRTVGNGPRKPTDPTIDPREIHHVVVPYSPLFYQRCNDWPPEPQYAQVKRCSNFDDARRNMAAAYRSKTSRSVVSEQSGAAGSGSSNRVRNLRRRLRRRGVNGENSSLEPMRARADTAPPSACNNTT